MAFSKAKILRFNDVQSCAPPPGAYTPKFENHIPGSVVYSKDNPKPCPDSPTSSSSDLNSIRSTASVPTFRTPTVPRRRKRAMTHSIETKSKMSSRTDEDSEELREKIVECANKDETIKDLESQIEELKLSICSLKIEREDLIQNKDELLLELNNVRQKLEFVNKELNESNVEKQTMSDEFTKLRADLKAQNAVQMQQLQENLTLVEERLKINFTETESVLKETEVKLMAKETKCCNLEDDLLKLRDEYNNLEKKYEEALNKQNDLRKSYNAELDSIKDQNTLNIVDMEKDMVKIVDQWRNTVSHLENESKRTAEEMKMSFEFEKEEIIKQCYNKLDEMEFISTGMRREIHYLQSECDDMQNRIYIETQEKEKYKKQLGKLETLKQDLLISQQNLAQLTKELEILESAKLQDEFKCNEIQQKYDSLKADHEILKQNYQIEDAKIAHLQTIINDKDMEFKVLQSFTYDQQEINSVAQSLITQVKNEKKKLEEKIVDYQFKEKSKDQEINRVKQDLNLQCERNENLITDISALRKAKDELEQGFEKPITQQIKITELTHKIKEREYKMVKSFTKQNEDRTKFEYEKIIAEQNALIGPFREQLQRFEEEHKILLAHKNEAKNEAKEMGLKYAEILGHQNHKQKLKHMLDLKKKNINLTEQKQNFETEILQKNRTIETLQNKILQLTKSQSKCRTPTDKENICVNNNLKTRTNSPVALKERN